ncbi:hypothetical protein ACFSMW_00405 [Virgibacillus halophilus]|uniref:DUF3993 domain-containing protein n=1 Tax=Tigheibacillus halophilus TaxID=361280 RepID=A0ABU5C1H2_9BACI|nr:hypothetical protein [Virgibacillus halophilus]
MKHFKGYQMMMKMFIIVGIILLFPASTYSVFADSFRGGPAEKPQAAGEADQEQDKLQPHPISEKEISYTTDKFMDILVQKTAKDYKVLGLDNKQQLFKKFSKIATQEAAKQFVDFYYEEKQDGLYIKPTETPPWFIDANAYSLKKLNMDHYKVKQQNKTSLYGDYTIHLDFQWLQGKWKITDVNYE